MISGSSVIGRLGRIGSILALGLLFLPALGALGCGADGGDGSGDVGSDFADKAFDGFRITNYIVALESDLSGGDMMCGLVDGDGADDCYPADFLCSGHGVAMQGTGMGHDADGKEDAIYIKWVSGGGGWAP